MSRLYIKIIIAVTFCLADITAFASDFIVEGYKYFLHQESDGGNYATLMRAPVILSGNIVIPPSISHEGSEYVINALSVSAFEGCAQMTSVIIPDAVKRIGSSAFKDCLNLITVILPSEIAELDSSLFENCINLKAVNIPKFDKKKRNNHARKNHDPYIVNLFSVIEVLTSSDFENYEGFRFINIPGSVKRINADVFKNCHSITSIYIPRSVEYIDRFAFPESGIINEIQVNRKNRYYTSSDGILFSKDKTKLQCYPCGRGSKKYRVPRKVKVIDAAFRGNKNLVTINIHKKVEDIRESAFEGCSGLESVNIPENIKIITRNMFAGCGNLTHITIPESVNEIEEKAFSSCSSLKTIFFDGAVEDIHSDAFIDCGSIKEIYCNCSEPPGIDSDYFLDPESCRLYVTKGSLSDYRMDENWNKFSEIIGF